MKCGKLFFYLLGSQVGKSSDHTACPDLYSHLTDEGPFRKYPRLHENVTTESTFLFPRFLPFAGLGRFSHFMTENDNNNYVFICRSELLNTKLMEKIDNSPNI